MQFLKESFFLESRAAICVSVSALSRQTPSPPETEFFFYSVGSSRRRRISSQGGEGGREDEMGRTMITKCLIVAKDFSLITSSLVVQTGNKAGRDRNQFTLRVFCTFQLLCRCLRGSRRQTMIQKDIKLIA